MDLSLFRRVRLTANALKDIKEPEVKRQRIDDLYEGERYMKVRFLLPALAACYFIPVATLHFVPRNVIYME